MKLIKTTSSNKDFTELVTLLDAGLAVTDGANHSFYDEFNKLDKIKHVVVAYQNDTPIGCGAMKSYDEDTIEVKRMFTLPAYRGKGVASAILAEIEHWATELGYSKCILETGVKQTEAIELYTKKGYGLIPNYGQYHGIEDSMCFEKLIGEIDR